MFELHTNAPERQALYCPKSGTRIAPDLGSSPPPGTAVAVAVFDDGRTIPIAASSIIGREPELSQHLIDLRAGGQLIAMEAQGQTISRAHLLLEVVGWNVAVVDLGSSNGTAVSTSDGTWQRVVPGLQCWLEDDQQVMIGSRTFSIHRTGR